MTDSSGFESAQKYAEAAHKHLTNANKIQSSDFENSLVSSRKFLESALQYFSITKSIAPIAYEEKLVEFIDRLGVSPRGLTTEQKKWCHQLRNLGNKGAHSVEREPTPADAVRALALANQIAESFGLSNLGSAGSLEEPPPPPEDFSTFDRSYHEPDPRTPSAPLRAPSIFAFLALVVAGLLGLLLVRHHTATNPEVATRTVGALNVNLRSAPDPASTILAVLTPGTILTDLASSTAPDGAVWIKVRTTAGEVGFINDRLMVPRAAPTPVVAQTPPAASGAPPTQTPAEQLASPAEPPPSPAPQPASPVEPPSSSAPSPDVERARLAQEVQQVIFASDVSHGPPIPNTTYAVPQGMGAGIFVEYANASPSDQYAVVVRYGNQINTSLCTPTVIGDVSGSYACQLGNLSVGHYRMFFQINGQDINVTDFNVLPSMPSQVAGQQASPYSMPQRFYPRNPYAEQQRNYPVHHARPGTACYAAFGDRIAPNGQPYCN